MNESYCAESKIVELPNVAALGLVEISYTKLSLFNSNLLDKHLI